MAKIIFADDDPFLIKIYSNRLIKDGHEVITASDGLTALEKIKQYKPDLIVLDIMLPRMNGMDILSELRTQAAFKKTPVVFLSNLSQDRERSLAEEKGVTEFVVKAEHTPSEIIAILEKYLPAAAKQSAKSSK